MSLKKDQIVSAEVILRSASGKKLKGADLITSENIQEFRPSYEEVKNATTLFATAGFDVGKLIGISFSITAPVRTFEKVFSVQLREGKNGDVEVVKKNDTGSYELPLHALPRLLREIVTAVTFTPPPDFGPTDFL